MRARLGRWLHRLAVVIAGECPCRSCAAIRRAEAVVRRHNGALPRSERRAIHRNAWKVGR